MTARRGISTAAQPAGSGESAPAGVRIADSDDAREVAERTRDRILFDAQIGCHNMAGRTTQRALDLLG